MKALIVSLLFIILLSSFALSQECDSCGCATKPTYTSPDPATFIGGKLKPNRSDLNNTDPNNYSSPQSHPHYLFYRSGSNICGGSAEGNV